MWRKPELMRKPMPLNVMQTKLDEINRQLSELNEPEMGLEETFGARLYTGPMCVSVAFRITVHLQIHRCSGSPSTMIYSANLVMRSRAARTTST